MDSELLKSYQYSSLGTTQSLATCSLAVYSHGNPHRNYQNYFTFRNGLIGTANPNLRQSRQTGSWVVS